MRQSFTSFSLNYPCSPAPIGFPVAKATGFHACCAALKTNEGKLGLSFFFFFLADRFPGIFIFWSMFFNWSLEVLICGVAAV